MSVVDGIVAIVDSGATEGDQAEVHQTIDSEGGEILLFLGDSAAVVSGGQPVADALTLLIGLGLSAVVPTADDVPYWVDSDLAELIVAWFASQDPAVVAAKDDPARDGESWDPLGGCGQGLMLP
jgi:hypothetical protein